MDLIIKAKDYEKLQKGEITLEEIRKRELEARKYSVDMNEIREQLRDLSKLKNNSDTDPEKLKTKIEILEKANKLTENELLKIKGLYEKNLQLALRVTDESLHCRLSELEKQELEWQQQRSELNKKLKELSDTNQTIVMENKELIAKLKDLEQSGVEYLQDESKDLSKLAEKPDLRKLHLEKISLEKELNKHITQGQFHKERLNKVEKELETKQFLSIEAEKKYQQLNLDKELVLREKTELLNKLALSQEQYQAEVTQLKAQYEAGILSWQNKLQNEREKRASDESLIVELQNKLNDLQQKYAENENILKTKNQQDDFFQNQIAELKVENEKFFLQSNELRKEADHYQDEHQSMQKKLADAEILMQQYQNKLDELNKENETQLQQILALQSENQQSKDVYEQKVITLIKDQEKDHREMEQQHKIRLEQDELLSGKNKEILLLNDQIKQFQLELSALNENVSKLNTQHEIIQSEKIQLSAKLDSAEQSLADMEQNIVKQHLQQEEQMRNMALLQEKNLEKDDLIKVLKEKAFLAEKDRDMAREQQQAVQSELLNYREDKHRMEQRIFEFNARNQSQVSNLEKDKDDLYRQLEEQRQYFNDTVKELALLRTQIEADKEIKRKAVAILKAQVELIDHEVDSSDGSINLLRQANPLSDDYADRRVAKQYPADTPTVFKMERA